MRVRVFLVISVAAMSTQGDANDVVEAPSADGTLVLLVPVIVTLVLLGGAYVIYVAIARPKRAVMQDPTRKKKKRGRHGPRKHPFESRCVMVCDCTTCDRHNTIAMRQLKDPRMCVVRGGAQVVQDGYSRQYYHCLA